jgi:hypothetical protein
MDEKKHDNIGRRLDLDGDGHLSNAEALIWVALLVVGLLGIGGLVYAGALTPEQIASLIIGIVTGGGSAGLARVLMDRRGK